MMHREKVERLIEDLRKRGVNPSTTAPPLFRLLWWLAWRFRRRCSWDLSRLLC